MPPRHAGFARKIPTEMTSPVAGSRLPIVGTSALGGLLGGLAGAAVVIGFTEVLKGMLAVVSSQERWALIVVVRLCSGWRSRFWSCTRIRAERGPADSRTGSRRRPTPSPAGARLETLLASRRPFGSHGRDGALRRRGGPLSVAPGASSHARYRRHRRAWRADGDRGARGVSRSRRRSGPGGSRGHGWRRLLRPAAVGGAAAGVAALMGIPLVGTAYILELGWRQRRPADDGAGDGGGWYRWGRRVAHEHLPRRRPDPPGRAQGAAALTPSSRSHGAFHRGARRRDHRDHGSGGLSRESVDGQPRRATRTRHPGSGSHCLDPRDTSPLPRRPSAPAVEAITSGAESTRKRRRSPSLRWLCFAPWPPRARQRPEAAAACSSRSWRSGISLDGCSHRASACRWISQVRPVRPAALPEATACRSPPWPWFSATGGPPLATLEPAWRPSPLPLSWVRARRSGDEEDRLVRHRKSAHSERP